MRIGLLATLLSGALSTAVVHAAETSKCAKYNTETTLSGVVTKSATYVDPGDFGWAPKNGFQPYTILVTETPVCFDDNGEYVSGVYVLQIFGVELPSQAALKPGVAVTVTGTVFPPDTAHHFGTLMFNASSVTIKSK